jgi:glycosyltransferase involved in cell wall biosynthesis
VTGRPRILVAIKGLGIGGAEKLIAEGARYWDREAFDYRVAYALPWKDALVPSLESQGIPVTCIGSKRGFLPDAWLRLGRMASEQGIDLIHAHLPSLGIVARVGTRVPVVYTEHNIAQSYRWPLRVANRLTYRGNAATIAVSDAVAASVAGFGGREARVVVNGVAASVSAEDAWAARVELGVPADQPLVAHVGNIRPHKGHANLIAAAALLRHRDPDTLVVSIGGEKHAGDLERLERLARDRGVADRIRFLGSRSDALRFVAAADVVVNPSDFEGLPVAVLEAMALGRPVVATAVGGVPDLVAPGASGILVEPRDPVGLAAAVDTLLDDPAGARLIGANATEVIQQHYGLQAMVRSIESVYRAVLNG